MYHYLIELAFWILLAFFAGCFLGGLGRMRFGVADVVPAVVPVVARQATAAVVPKTAAAMPKRKKAVAVKARPVKKAKKK